MRGIFMSDLNKNKVADQASEDAIQLELNRKTVRKERMIISLPYIGILVLVLFFTGMTGGRFIGGANLKLLLNQCFTMVIVSVGAAFLYAIGAMDMAIGAVMSVSAMFLTLLFTAGVPFVLSLLVSIIAAIMFMCITGLAKCYLKISSFIASLCVMNVCQGIVLAIITLKGKVDFPYSRISWMDNSIVKLITLLIVIIVGFVLFNYTAFGKNLKAIGGNVNVARISGIRVEKTTLLAYMVMGITIGIAALFALIRGGVADTSIGSGMPLNVMTAIVLGGFPLTGGAHAKYSGPLIGAVMVTILTNGLALMGYANAIGYGVKGLLFIAVIGLTYEKSNGKLIN